MADTQQTVLAGRYRLVDQLGRGGMGAVWRAHDELLDREVAVKEVLLPPGVDDETRDDLLERTKREARAAARLNHPNVVTVFDVVEAEGRPWIVMELVKSRGLNQVVREEGPLPPERVASIGVQLLNALGVAHASGIYHRDVKPSNVLVADNGRVVLADFGIASVQGDPAMTRSGLILGSPSYIAPERARGLAAGPASDLWAVGATLYSAVEGRPPYDRDGVVTILTAAAMEDPDPYQNAGPLEPVLSALLRREPETRPSVDQARLELRQIALMAPPVVANTGLASGPNATAVMPAPEIAPTSPPPKGAKKAAKPPKIVRSQASASPISPAAPASPAPVGLAGSTPLTPKAPGRVYGQPPKRALIAVLAVVVLAALIGVGGIVYANRDSAADNTTANTHVPDSSASPSAAATSASPSAKPSASPTPSPTAPAAGTIPSGWHKENGPNGYTIGVPDGWDVQRSGSDLTVQDRKGLFLLIQQTSTPRPDARADWQEKARYRVSQGDFPGYQEISIKAVPYRNYPTNADWEFTFNSDNGPVHVRNRGFKVDARHGYGFYWSVPTGKWNSQTEALFQSFANSFVPAS